MNNPIRDVRYWGPYNDFKTTDSLSAMNLGSTYQSSAGPNRVGYRFQRTKLSKLDRSGFRICRSKL